MMLSVITPVHPQQSAYLPQAAASVIAVRELLDVQWLVVVDGPGAIPDIPADEIITLPRRSGISAARNSALAAADGQWILPLDADDLLLPEGISQVYQQTLALAAEDNDLGFVAYRRRLVDGRKTVHWFTQQGFWSPGELQEQWVSPFIHFHPNSVIYRRSAALALGGYPALATHEDLAFILALNHDHSGIALPIDGLHYRAWERQASARQDFPLTKQQAFQFTVEMINAGRQQRKRAPITAPAPSAARGRDAAEMFAAE